ncbi:MAG: YigZ family protein [Bacteroidales bacterium]|nr:YigZ family protein [Bacteroidales bacterium]
MNDIYRTIKETATATVTEKRSKFIAFAHPVSDVEEVKEIVARYRKEYYDARHVCWAYMLGHERKEFRANDDGEPSGTAGKPILGQINSNELTNILIVVIRYFGGIKLGTSGLIMAYKAAAAEVLTAAEIIERTVDETIRIKFEYPFLNGVMKVVKDMTPEILRQSFGMDCEMVLRIRKSEMPGLRGRLENVDTLQIY